MNRTVTPQRHKRPARRRERLGSGDGPFAMLDELGFDEPEREERPPRRKPGGSREARSRELRSYSPPGTDCTYRAGGCPEPALPGRWVCPAHGTRLEALGAEHRATGGRR